MNRVLCHCALALAILLLQGCVTHAPRLAPSSDPQLLQAQIRREAALAKCSNWTLQGRIAVSDGHNNGSGRIVWQQRGNAFSIQLSAPVSRQSWRLSGDTHWAQLDGLADGPHAGPDAEILLQEVIGWSIPLANLTAWLRGARTHGQAELTFSTTGLPDHLQQNAWTIEYRQWQTDIEPPLPRKVFAQAGTRKLRLVIEDWGLPSSTTP